jgi:hypothetical protein
VAIIEAGALEDAAGEDVEVEVGGDLEAGGVVEEFVVNGFVIEHLVADVFVTQEVNEGDGVFSFSSQGLDEELKIISRKTAPTIGIQHREPPYVYEKA